MYRVTPGPERMQPGDDVAEARWFPVATLPYRQIAFPSMRRALRAWTARR